MIFFSRPISLYLSCSLAAAGMLYELMIAQLLAVVLGGTLLQYSLTIGLFTLALGAASLFYPHLPDGMKSLKFFFILQIATAASALFSHFVLEWLFLRQPNFSYAGLCYAFPLVIGLLTGLELPLILENQSVRFRSACIASDYLGMFLATLIFPLWILPVFGPAGATWGAIALNIVAAALSSTKRSGVEK